MAFSFLLLTLLLIALPFMVLFPLYFAGRRRRQEQIALLEPLFLKYGFRRANLFEQLSEQILYKAPKSKYRLFISLQDLPHRASAQNLLTFLTIWVEMPLQDFFFIRTPDLDEEENSILYETYWRQSSSDALASLGLRVLCTPASRQDLERRLASEGAQNMFATLCEQQDSFYIYGDADGFLRLGFGFTRSPETQRARRWLETAKGLVRLFYAPNRSFQIARRKRKALAQLLFLFLLFLFIGLVSALLLFANFSHY